MFSGWTMKSLGRSFLVIACFLAGTCAAGMAAGSITGVVRNQTLGQFAAEDDVILLHVDQGIREEVHAKTDVRGAFTLTVQCSDKFHLVRVIHQGVNYDQQAAVGDAIIINVFDRAAKVQGVTGSIEIIRIGTKGSLLHVSDLVEIRNNSSPPLTQAGERTFEVYLPAHARIDSVLAASSEKIGVRISARLLPGEPGHYTVNFPLRPGATQFAFNYDLPYNGHVVFHTKGEHPVEQLAVMIPPTMKFSSNSTAFQVIPTGNSGFRAEAAVHLREGERPEFEISGGGTLPALPSQVPAKVPMAAVSAPALSATGSGTRVQGAKALEVVPAPSLSRFSEWRRWALVASLVLALGGCGLFLRRRERPPSKAITTVLQVTGQPRQISTPVIEVLKNELFQLEIERVQGTVSGEEYESAKQALEGTVKRAMTRVAAGS